jgi:uncharacterized protein YuzE
MTEIRVTLSREGQAYIELAGGAPGEVRDSVVLEELEEAESIPALSGIVLDFDHYGRLVGIEIVHAAETTLPPALIDAAERLDF